MKLNLLNSTLIATTMNFSLLLFFLFFPMFLLPEESNTDFKERILLEDFESKIFSNQSFQVQSNTEFFPDVRMSKNLTSPEIISNTSLLIRISNAGSGIPMDLIFKNPYEIMDYLIEIEFNIYSNQANGELFVYILDSKFQKHLIKIGSLNFDGWKQFKVPIGNKITQKDFILKKSAFIKITGIQLKLNKKLSKTKEDLIAIDDIFILKRKKYQFLETYE